MEEPYHSLLKSRASGNKDWFTGVSTVWHGFFGFIFMEEKNYTGVIPPQESGAAIDAAAKATFKTMEEAKNFFREARRRLLQVNDWDKIAGSLSASFQLTDSAGNEMQGEAQKGYFIKVDIPGPGTTTGDGYDWVAIEIVEDSSQPEIESTGMRVRPASNPMNSDNDVAHFYSKQSTSNFTVTREGRVVTAAIYDRNIQPNTETSAVTDKIRDAIVGAGGITAFSKIQWKMLADGLVAIHD